MADATLYALRHAATGLCMPALNGAGYSYWEPTRDDHTNLRPRLFFTLKSAQNARSAWAQGCWKRESGAGNNWECPESYDEVVINDPPTPRALADLKIVTLELMEFGHA